MSTISRASKVISKVALTLVLAAGLAVLSWRLGYQAGHKTPCAEAYRAGQDSNAVFQEDAYVSASREAYSNCLEAIRAGRDVWGVPSETICKDKEFGVRSAGPDGSRGTDGGLSETVDTASNRGAVGRRGPQATTE